MAFLCFPTPADCVGFLYNLISFLILITILGLVCYLVAQVDDHPSIDDLKKIVEDIIQKKRDE